MPQIVKKCSYRKIRLLLWGILFTCIGGLIVLWWFPSMLARAISEPMDYEPLPIVGVEMECFDETSPVVWSYCINKVATSENKTLVYHFHGRRGNATWWNDDTYYSGEVFRVWQAMGISPPTVVSISFGPLWLLKEQSLLDTFVDTVMPRIELSIGTPIDKRLVVGESMGGINALLVWLKTEAKFSGAAALCPPLPTISPMASLNEMVTYVSKKETSFKRAMMMIAIGRSFFNNERSWRENNPLEVVIRADLTEAGALYLTCGKLDDWGCMDGSLQLATVAKKRGASVEWYPREGGHCDIDPVSLAQFLGGTGLN